MLAQGRGPIRRGLVIVVLLAIAALIGASQAQRSDALFHIMRVYGVMAGASADADVQYVELRMAASGQTIVGGHHLCFYDASGSPYARFGFTGGVSDGANGASILIGTSEFDAAWAAGTPDFVFSGANTIAIAGGADVAHPMRSPGGKVSFGTDATATPALMCQASFALVDSVAYGTGYSGAVDFGTKLNADLPTAGSDAVRLQGPVCFPPGCTRDNSTDYAITDVNVPGDHPRNNAGAAGPVTIAGATFSVLKDFIPDSGASVTVILSCTSGSASPASASASEAVPAAFTVTGFSGDPNCTATESPIPTGYLSSGTCAAALVAGGQCTITNSLDSDGDGFPDSTDNCPQWPNPGQGLPAWPVPAGDPDCDGTTSADETVIGTDPNDPCGLSAWPPDFDDNAVINTTDVFQVLPPFFGTSVPPTSSRRDLSPNGVINTTDVFRVLPPFLGSSCTP